MKAGHVSVPRVLDLRGREKAAIGVLISFEEPTKPIRTEAASTGFFTSRWGQHPRLQLITVAELLAGKQIDAPRLTGTSLTFKAAPRKRKKDGEQLSLEYQRSADVRTRSVLSAVV